ncbi:hypothetical protein [Salimicrobium jeotgali]|nr:hypothetical protein [Salimicrobium jeotgali]
METIETEAEYRTTIHSDQVWHYQYRKWGNVKETSYLPEYVQKSELRK